MGAPMMNITRRFFAAGAAAVTASLAGPAAAGPVRRRPQLSIANATMRRAVRFMTDKAAVRGGYVWTALPDFSRRWGELEARPTQIWVQPPGTPTIGHAFLDAYHATGEDMYLRACEATADALLAGQHPAGGWNYLVDFAGEASLTEWYDTVGANAWRLEEFHDKPSNATFDDATTTEAATLLLRLVVGKRDAKYAEALDKAIKFLLDAQYASGGWPQRAPVVQGDYTGHITFNDDVIGENIKFLALCYRALGEDNANYAAFRPAIEKAMGVYLAAHQKGAQPGWAIYHTVGDLKPAAGRSFEPAALATHVTANNVAQLMNFYEMTGDEKFLARIPETLDWLDKVALPADEVKDGRTHPTFIEIGTDKPLYVHRLGSNVANGSYFANNDPNGVITHYAQTRAIDVAGLRARYRALKAMSREDAMKDNPIAIRNTALPRFFTLKSIELKGLGTNRGWDAADAPTEARVREVIAALNDDGFWPTPLTETSRPYTGPGSATPVPGDFSQTRAGDATDTSPFDSPAPVIGISASTFIRNLAVLTRYVDNGESPVQQRWFD